MDNKITFNSYFLEHGGEAAELIKTIDWSNNPLGPMEKWPENLKNTLATLLATKFPMFLWWGNDRIQFYNDSYRPSLGNDGKHPTAMGQKGIECWPENWDFINPLITKVMTTGESVWYDNMLFPIFRNGKIEDAYWTFSYSPVRGDNQTIEGVLVVCNETTKTVLQNLQIEENKEQLEYAIEAAELGTFDLNPITNKFSANNRLKSWFGLNPDEEIPLNLATDIIADEDRENVLKAIEDALKYELGGKYEIDYTIIHPTTNEKKIVRAKGKTYFDENKAPYRFNGTLQDITKYVSANEEIVKARQLTDLTIKSMGMGLFNIDFVEEKMDYSPEFAQILSGSKSKNLSRKDFLKHIHPDDLHLRAAALKIGMETGSFFYSPRVIWDDGSQHRITISGARINDAKEKPIAFIGTVIDITEQENKEIALQNAENNITKLKKEADALFRNVTDSSPTGLWLSDKKGAFTYLNLTLIEWTGLSYGDLLGFGWTNAIVEEDRERAAAVFEAALNTKSHYDVLFKLKKGTGEIVWCRAAGDPFYDEDGEYAGYAGFCMDVDEIISGRKALSDSEERFSLMIEQAPVGICLFTGLEMKIEIANTLMCTYWGKDKSAIGQDLEVAIPELKGQPFLEILQNVYLTGETYEATSVPAQLMVKGVLTTIYFDFTYKPIRDSNGTIYGIMDIASDVTEKVLASQKLEEARISLSGAVELAELATWSLHIPSKTYFFSNRFMDWLGFSESENSMKETYNRIPSKKRKAVQEEIQKAISSESTGIYDNEHPITNINTGQIRIIHAAAQLFYDADGNAEYLSGTAQDVTKERKLQEELKFKVKERTIELRNANHELEINNQELQQFAYIASHDLQEPVRKIKVFMQMLESFLESDIEKSKFYIDKINNASSRMTALIKDVLGFSQLATTAKVFECVDLNQIASELLNDFDLKIEEKQAKITFDNLPTLEANKLQMSQLFDNIISNALKYSKEDVHPEIAITSKLLSQKDKSTLKLDVNDDYFEIKITDNGIGFDQQYAEKIFNIFQRLHGKESYDGTGIGLAMCRKIVQNHNGEIRATSQQGIGTTFTIILPKSHSKKQL